MEQAPPTKPPLVMAGGDDAAPNRLLAQVDLAVAVLLACAGLLFAIFMPALIGAGGIETAQDFMTISPAFFPRLAMGLLALTCVPYVLQAIRNLARSSKRDIGAQLIELRRAGFMVVIAVGYAGTMSWLGFLLATMLVSAVASYFLGLRRPLAFVPGVILVPIVVRFVFERMLYIALPRSEIEFVAGIEDAAMRFLVDILL
ncbi:MAG: tripartite tricarboxylate transporter TctB family protein [Alphaproteobacteria bacterium]|nr:tripartite tricarboxylate transporter TctB family protein [Alphaproteobacteria bacterium]